MNQKLENQITQQLNSLAQIIEKIRNKAIEPDNSEMWDSSYYYDLASKLKVALALLQDQNSQQLNDWGEPIVLAKGICSLLDDWESQKEQEND